MAVPAPPIPRQVSRPPKIPTSAFASRSSFGKAIVSPDGKSIAVKLWIDGHWNIATLDAASKNFTSRVEIDSDRWLEWFRWAGSRRIIYSLSKVGSIYGVDVRYTQLYVNDIQTNTPSYVGSKHQGLVGDDVLYVDPDGEYVLLTTQRDLFHEPEVRRYPLDGSNTQKDELVQKSRTRVWQWVADDTGVVRIGLGIAQNRLQVLYRKTADEGFRVVAGLTGDKDRDQESVWDALRIINGSDEGLALDAGPSGKIALRRFNYATREPGDVIYENKDWDVTAFDVDKDGNPVAVYYTDDQDRIAWLDPTMKQVQAALEEALPGKQVWVSSRADDDSRMIVWAGGADDPGSYYLYTTGTKKLERLTQLRPGLPPPLLAPVKPVEYTARDGTEIHAYLTMPVGREPKGLPLIILPHGGPYGIRDKLDYNDEVQLLANRGYAVLQPNYRGSDGYGEDFVDLGSGQIGRAMQDDLDDAMDWAVKQGIADAKRVCVVGASYGGYAALWAVIRNPERYRCAASFAGVTDWEKQLSYDGDFFSRKGRKAWRTRIRGEDKSFDLDDVSPAKVANMLSRPILLAHGELDSTVPFKQFEEMRDALDKAGSEEAEYLVFDEEGHGFNTTEDEQKWYDALIAFLAKNDPAD